MNDDNQQIASRVRRLRRLDCCAVSDTLDRLNLTGVVTAVPQRSGQGRIAGRVTTLKLGVGDPPAGKPRHLGTTAIESAGADDVIVVEQRTGVDAGCWGGLLSLGAKMRGVAGVIADGPVRDIDEARAYQFPIFSRGLTARTARGRVVEQGTNVPITVWDVAVSPGHYVVADRSAVIFIDVANIDAVLAVAETIVAREASMAVALVSGKAIGDVMGSDYEFMLKG